MESSPKASLIGDRVNEGVPVQIFLAGGIDDDGKLSIDRLRKNGVILIDKIDSLFGLSELFLGVEAIIRKNIKLLGLKVMACSKAIFWKDGLCII